MARRNFKALKALIAEVMTAKPVDTGAALVTAIAYNELGDVISSGRVTTPKLLTYLDVPAVTWEVRERGAAGRRTLYTMWLSDFVGQEYMRPAGTIEARTVTGDSRRGTLEVLVESHVVTINGVTLFSELNLSGDDDA